MIAHPAGPRHAEEIHHGGAPPRPQSPADVLMLAPNVWPHNTVRGGDGVVSIAGVSVTDIATEFGTPVFVVDEDDFRSRCHEIAAAFGGGEYVHYAAKAFLCTEVARWINEEGLALDVASGGELAVALHAGFPAERIALHGNNKSVAELRQAVAAGVGSIIVDSGTEIARLNEVARDAGVRQAVLVRVTVGVEAHTHEFIATAHEDQKFGFALGEAADDAIAAVLSADSLVLAGLHSHIGSQIFDTSGFEVAAHRVVELAARVRDVHGVEVAELNLGGGLGIAYVSSDDPQTPAGIADRLRAIVHRECDAAGLRVPRLSVEPGRAIVGRSGVTVYEVGTVKDVRLDGGLTRSYISVDGGMSDNIRTALYDAEYTCALANRSSTAEPKLSRVVGKHCESGDIVVRDTWLAADVGPGDLLAVAATGAYCRSMASNYNHVPRPPVVGVRDGGSTVLVRRETLDDLLRLDAGMAAIAGTQS